MLDDENELKDIRNNIIEWYPFDKKDRILNISDREYVNQYLISKEYSVDERPNRRIWLFIVYRRYRE